MQANEKNAPNTTGIMFCGMNERLLNEMQRTMRMNRSEMLTVSAKSRFTQRVLPWLRTGAPCISTSTSGYWLANSSICASISSTSAELALVSKAVTAGDTKAIATVLSAEKRCESTIVKPTDEPASRPSPIDNIRSVLSESGSLETI